MSTKTAQNNLTDVQQQAINVFRQKWGRNWKFELSHCWTRSNYPGMSQSHAASLQQLRNTHGPKWLNSYGTAPVPAGAASSKASTSRRLIVEVKGGNITLMGEGDFGDIEIVLFDRDCEGHNPDDLATIDFGVGRNSSRSGLIERLDVGADVLKVSKIFEALDSNVQTAAPGH